MEPLLLSIGTLIALLLFLIFRRLSGRDSSQDSQSALLMQQQLESMRSDFRDSLHNVSDSVNRQLGSITVQLQSQTSSVGSRLDSAARVIGDVQRNLGSLGKATEELKELGRGVSKLEELLSSPKLRGGFGEYLLEDLLKQVLPGGHFEMQYAFKGGATVDAIIRTSDRIVPVDSKFPLENFQRMISAGSETDRKLYQRSFVGDVKKHIDAIATKYIRPDEGTFPFALMYIPAENVYYEVIIKDEQVEGAGLYTYAIEKNVVPVSPNSLFAYLQVIALGLRGLQIEQSARDVVNSLSRLQGDLSRMREAFDTLGSHIDNARKKFDEVDKRLSNFEGRLETVTEHPPATISRRPIEGSVVMKIEHTANSIQ